MAGGERRRARRPLATVVVLLVALLPACGGAGGGPPVLRWYVNPDNGGQASLAASCSGAAGGRYRIEVSPLPNDATGQREQLVRRLAAADRSVDLMSLDVVFVPEFANAGFLRPFTGEEAAGLTEGVLAAPLGSATWKGRLVAAPFYANSQLLWFRRSVARRAGLDPERRPVTWRELLEAAERTGTTVQVQAGRYEGYMVWINALVESAGGHVLADPEAGREARPGLDSDAGARAAEVIAALGRSPAADPALDTAMEETSRAGFQGPRGGFLANWPYVYGAAKSALEDGTLDRAVFEDIGWARYPQVLDDRQSRPPLGGIHLGVGAFSAHPSLAVEAVRCLTADASQEVYMLAEGNPAARAAVYDAPAVRDAFPMADLIRQSIDAAAPRPLTPHYPDVSTATIRSFHPPRAVDPAATPRAAARLVVAVLHDEVLL